MSVEENKEIARRYFSVGVDDVKKDMEPGKDVFHAPEFVLHSLMGDMNYQEYMGLMSTMVTAFPDFKYNPEDIIAEGDKVVVRYTFTGTHQGDFQGIPPTGKKVKTEGIGIIKIIGGKLVEAWFAADSMSMLQQLGVSPPGG